MFPPYQPKCEAAYCAEGTHEKYAATVAEPPLDCWNTVYHGLDHLFAVPVAGVGFKLRILERPSPNGDRDATQKKPRGDRRPPTYCFEFSQDEEGGEPEKKYVAACNQEAHEHEASGSDPNIWIAGFEGDELPIQIPTRHAQCRQEDGSEKRESALLHEPQRPSSAACSLERSGRLHVGCSAWLGHEVSWRR